MKITKTTAIRLLIATLTLIGISSCSKDEGKGGNSGIQGYVYNVTNDGDIISDGMGGWKFATDTTPAIDKTVFIVYGGGIGEYDDKTATNAFGYYKFDYLREGNYMIYVVGDSADQKSVVFRDVKIGSKGTTGMWPIYVNDGKNAKCSGIIGSLMAMYSNEDDYVAGVGLRVYIKNVNGGEQNDTRADDNGYFRFAKLQPNTQYTIWAESQAKKNYAVTAEGYTITTGAEGTVTNMIAAPILVNIY